MLLTGYAAGVFGADIYPYFAALACGMFDDPKRQLARAPTRLVRPESGVRGLAQSGSSAVQSSKGSDCPSPLNRHTVAPPPPGWGEGEGRIPTRYCSAERLE